MSVQTVVPATLLEDIKKGLIAVGYAHESTPLSFVQDCYFKYVMVHQVAMTKGFSPQIPYAIALLPQAIQDQLTPAYNILTVMDQWGNNGGLLSNRYPGNVIDDVLEHQLTNFDYACTRTGYTANKESKFAWNIGTVSTAGLNNDPVVGEAHAVNRDGRLDIKIADFDIFEIVLSKSNGFPIHQWAEDVAINDRPPAVPTESISIKFSSAEPGIIKSTVNGVAQPDIDMGTADESTRFQFRILRNPENIDEVTLSAYVYNGVGGQQNIASGVAMFLPPHETKTLNLSCQAIAKVGSENSMIYLTSSLFDGNEA